jgi:hypothetical protein
MRQQKKKKNPWRKAAQVAVSYYESTTEKVRTNTHSRTLLRKTKNFYLSAQYFSYSAYLFYSILCVLCTPYSV